MTSLCIYSDHSLIKHLACACSRSVQLRIVIPGPSPAQGGAGNWQYPLALLRRGLLLPA